MHGDSCSTTRVDPDSMRSTSFGDDCTGPSAPPCSRENALVDNRAAAPKSCLPSLEIRSLTAAGGLLPITEASTATRTTFSKPSLRLYSTEETNSKKKIWTSVSSAWYDSSFRKLLAVSSCRKVMETKSKQNRTFDPGGFQGRLCACPFLGSWRALLCGRFMLELDETTALFEGSIIRDSKAFRRAVRAKLFTRYVWRSIRWLFEARPALYCAKIKTMPARAALGYRRGERRSCRRS